MAGTGGDSEISFETVLAAERERIGERRTRLGLDPVGIDDGGLIGLALSGGGIRSSAFCLGVLQALGATKSRLPEGSMESGEASALDHVDIISSVSGGGYTAASTISGMNRTGKFPFESRLSGEETKALKHLRDHSNYLLARGFTDAVVSLAIYLRGLVAVVLSILPWLLLAAAITVALNQDLVATNHTVWSGTPIDFFRLRFFVFSVASIVGFAGFLALWAYVRSWPSLVAGSDVRGPLPTIAAVVLGLIAFAAFCDLQPVILRRMVDNFIVVNFAPKPPANALAWLNQIAAALGSLSAVVSLLAGRLAGVLGKAGGGISRRFVRAAIFLLILVASAVLPFLLWVAYINLSYWGLPDVGGRFPFAPAWLDGLAVEAPAVGGFRIAALYGLAALTLLVLSVFMTPNANSLHRLYRDRLSQAFFMDPDPPPPFRPDPTDDPWQARVRAFGAREWVRRRESVFDRQRFSDLRGGRAPLPLVNTTLNLFGAQELNRRARDGDFFTFTPTHFGSEATGYAPVQAMEGLDPALDYATAMAISGAAASANMGGKSIRLLTPTLALLNIRLGYWMRNPFHRATAGTRRLLLRFLRNFHLIFEMFSLLSPRSWCVYLTDGGHLENLGLYQLLKRRCRLILVVDAESDPELSFSALAQAELYARIDMACRLFLPWQLIRDGRPAAENAADGPKEEAPRQRLQVAVGRIEYGKGKTNAAGDRLETEDGFLIYVKAALSGTESDVIADYHRRYPAFPHETTIDQAFSEEQFEVYRALGFSALHGVLARRNDVAADLGYLAPVVPAGEPTGRTVIRGTRAPSANAAFDRLLQLLGVEL